jgi:mannose/fructose/sorbose-specific phosphotransferase system IIA component
MTDVILVAHGKLAFEAKNSLEMIFGEAPNFHPVGFLPNDGFETVRDRIEELLPELSDTVLIIADLFGGTPFNAACAVAMGDHAGRPAKIEVITGLSMPLLLEAASESADADATEMADQLVGMADMIVRKFVPEAVDDDDDL